MKVILKKNVKALGRAGDLVQVKEGYARNYLFPKKLACVATEKKLKEWTHLQKMAELKRKKNEAFLKKSLDELSEVVLNFKAATTTEGDKLFGSISTSEISKQLYEKGFEVNRQDIKSEGLKFVGEHKVKIHFGKDIHTEIKVIVEKK